MKIGFVLRLYWMKGLDNVLSLNSVLSLLLKIPYRFFAFHVEFMLFHLWMFLIYWLSYYFVVLFPHLTVLCCFFFS